MRSMLNLPCILHLLSILTIIINSAMAAEVVAPAPSPTTSSSLDHDMAVVQTQAQALIAIKAAITHDPSSCLSSWNTTSTSSNSTSDSDVVHTTLQQLYISDTWSDSSPPLLSISPNSFPPIANFSFCATIQMFVLFGIDASGVSFPSSLGDCQQLKTLTLSTTGLQGSIPPSIWQLPRLQYLGIEDLDVENALYTLNVVDAVYNQPDQPPTYKLHGSLPSTFGFCGAAGSTIEDMTIEGINLTGHIPASIGTCSSLQNLDLSQTSLDGPMPSSLGNLAHLQRLYLQSNNLEGPIPSSLGNLTHLRYLYLLNNNLDGPIPSSLGNLTLLEILDLTYNYFSGPIPSSLGNLAQLQTLYLDGNKLTGKIPAALGSCSQLIELRLGFNSLRGSIPSELGMLINLQELSLYLNSLEGIVPVDALHNLTALQVLRLFQNNLTGKIERLDLSKMPKLESFSVYGNALEGGLPAGLTESKELVIFDVQGNKYLTGSLGNTTTADITGLSNLRVLSVSYNQLSGDIPGWVWKLPRLQALDLSNNRFSGRFPATLTHLSYFKLNQTSHRNQTTLYEEVPVTIKNTAFILNYVQSGRIYIDVSRNHLEGEIPESFGELLGLTEANLSHNQMSGHIPAATFGRLMQLDVLDLSYNHLSGGIPQDLTSLRISTLNLANNQLEGAIPTQNNFNTRFTNESFKNNPGLCGYPLSSSCNTSNNNVTTTTTSHVGSTSTAMQLMVIWWDEVVSPWALLVGYPVGLALGFLVCRALSLKGIK